MFYLPIIDFILSYTTVLKTVFKLDKTYKNAYLRISSIKLRRKKTQASTYLPNLKATKNGRNR